MTESLVVLFLCSRHPAGRGSRSRWGGSGRRVAAFLVAALATAALSGCATYRAMPITEDSVSRTLAPPDSSEIRVRAASIEHPIMRPVAFDDRDGLSPDEAAILAVIANPSLRAVRDSRGIAEAQLLQSGILPNPQLSYSVETPVGGDTAGTVNGFGFGLGWDIASVASRGAGMDAAAAHAASVDLDVAWQEWQAAEGAKLHLYRLVIAQERLAAAERLGEVLEQSYETTERAVEMGVGTMSDLSSARAAVQDARAGMVEARSEMVAERLALDRALGLPGDRMVAPEKDIGISSLATIPAVQELTEGIEDRRLDLVALRLGYESQEASVRAAVLSQFPRINIGLTGARDTGGLRTASAGVSIDIPLFDRKQGHIALERATRKQLFDEYAARLFEARGDIALIVEELRAVSQLIANTDESMRAIEASVQRYQEASDKGTADILSCYRAWGQLYSKQLERLSLERRLVDLAIALEIASGRYIRTGDRSGAREPNEGEVSEVTE